MRHWLKILADTMSVPFLLIEWGASSPKMVAPCICRRPESKMTARTKAEVTVGVLWNVSFIAQRLHTEKAVKRRDQIRIRRQRHRWVSLHCGYTWALNLWWMRSDPRMPHLRDSRKMAHLSMSSSPIRRHYLLCHGFTRVIVSALLSANICMSYNGIRLYTYYCPDWCGFKLTISVKFSYERVSAAALRECHDTQMQNSCKMCLVYLREPTFADWIKRVRGSTDDLNIAFEF